VDEDTSAGGAAAWAQLLLTVLDEGRRTATYKLAVLLALIDCCALSADAQGRAPSRVPVRDLAVRVLELYWPQVRPYASADGAPLLRQSSQPKAVSVDAVRALRERALALGAHSPAAAERALPTAYAETVDLIQLNLVQMPLGKLQRPQGYTAQGAADYARFLYDDAPFHERVTARQLQQRPLDVVLQPHVGDWLVSLGGLLRPLVELHWTRAVASFSGEPLPEDSLRQFLFGTDRVSLRSVGPGLREAQAGLCFYCRQPLPAAGVEVDHFVPWSRLPNDALGNLVLADRRCNNAKRDHYTGLDLLARWADRPTDVLHQVADAAAWPLQLSRSRQVARGLYAHLPSGTALWQAPGVYSVLDRGRLLDLLQRLEGT
jgi:5-methylcytosine-specific restriction endonuclease McrA